MTTSYNLKTTNLFKPLKVGSKFLKNRTAHLPTTRGRATIDAVPTNLMLEYYSKRAIGSDGGLLVTEGTMVSKQASGWQCAPGIYNDKQASAWKLITDKVHDETDTKISCQLWYLGRAANALEMTRLGLPLVAPSVIYADEKSKTRILEAKNELKALTLEEIEILKKEYVVAAKNAIEKAGFDFIEIHSANGYLLDQFIHPSTNTRTDKYGGSIENHSRLVLEIVDLLIEAVGNDKIGIRLSPWGQFGGMKGSDEVINPVVNFGYLGSELNKRNIAYVSLVEEKHYLPESAKTYLSNEFMYQVFKNPILRCGNYSEKISLILEDDIEDRTIFGFGKHFFSNPDLPKRLQNDLELAPFDVSTFYSSSNLGYNTYGFYGEDLQIDVAKEEKNLPQLLV